MRSVCLGQPALSSYLVPGGVLCKERWLCLDYADAQTGANRILSGHISITTL